MHPGVFVALARIAPVEDEYASVRPIGQIDPAEEWVAPVEEWTPPAEDAAVG